MFRWLRLLPLLMLLAACGGGRQPKTVASDHPCKPSDFAMQCALTAPAHHFGASLAVAHGIDFAWSCPNPVGHDFGASYFSPDGSKNWTRGCMNWWHSAGAKTVGVYESSANRAQQGFNAGFQDAFTARSQARAVSEPDDRPIDYAVDCDCSVSSIFYYFAGADAGTAAVLHIPLAAAIQLVGVYGGYAQVAGLYASHVVGRTNWQTYAWSGGQWLPASIAPLEQILNGSAVDYDQAIAADYGQWPYAIPKPPLPPRPDPYAIFPVGPFPSPYGRVGERLTVEQFDGAWQHRDRYRGYLHITVQDKLVFLYRRAAYVALVMHHGWARDHLGVRYQCLLRDARLAAKA